MGNQKYYIWFFILVMTYNNTDNKLLNTPFIDGCIAITVISTTTPLG
ncbi:hypothetical protein QSE00_06890 [Arenibacter sp. M-2]|nr:MULTISPECIES: hypothetical protein [unclassified Arenibacter]MDL5511531.1 hypothetical protein [Arenibacter sp. M-2]